MAVKIKKVTPVLERILLDMGFSLDEIALFAREPGIIADLKYLYDIK